MRGDVAMTGFGRGTRILTPQGAVAIERLRAGDKVVTRDHGSQPLCSVGRGSPAPRVLASPPEGPPVAKSVTIPPDWMGRGCPEGPLSLASDHRVLQTTPDVALHFGTQEALAASGDLWPERVRPDPANTTFFQLLFDRHEIVLANGMWCESLFAPAPIDRLHTKDTPAVRHAHTARRYLLDWEAELLGSAHQAYSRRKRVA